MSEVHLRQDYIRDLKIGQTYNFIFDGSLSEGEAYKVELELYDYSDPFGTLVRYEIAKLQTGLGTERPIRIPTEIISLAPFHQRTDTRFRYVVTVYTVELSPTIISVWKSDNAAFMPRNTISGTFVYMQQNTIRDLEINKTYGFQFAGELDANEAYKVELEVFDYLNPDSEMQRYEIIRGQVMLGTTININIPKAISLLEAFQKRTNTRFRYVVTVYALTQQQEVIIVWKSDNDAHMPRSTITIPHYQIDIDDPKIQYIISHTNVEPQPYYDTLGRRWYSTIENITPIETNIEHNLTSEDLYGGELQCQIVYKTPNTFCYRGSATATESGFNYVSKYSPTSSLPESQTLVVDVILYDARFGVFESIAEYHVATNLIITMYPNPIITNNSTVMRVDQNGAPSSVGTYGVIDIDQSWIRIYDGTLLPPEDISLDSDFVLSFTSVPGGEWYDVYIDDNLYASVEDSEYEPIVAITNDSEIKYLFKEKEASPDTYKTGTYTSIGMVQDGYTQLQPSPSGAPDWLPDTYYRKQMYQDSVLGEIAYYWLLTEEPSDWGNNYTNYYEASLAFFNTTSDYTFDVTITDTFGLTYTKQLVLEKQNIFMHFGPKGTGLGVGELAETENVGGHLRGNPYITTPWGIKAGSFNRKVGTGPSATTREIRENLMATLYGSETIISGKDNYYEESPWGNYKRIPSLRPSPTYPVFKTGKYYELVGGEYTLLKTKPTDWSDNYTNYYYRSSKYPFTNVREYKRFNLNTFYSYEAPYYERIDDSDGPDDWSTNYFDYFELGYLNLGTMYISAPGLYFITYSAICDETTQIDSYSSQTPAELLIDVEMEMEDQSSSGYSRITGMNAMTYGAYINGGFGYMFTNNLTVQGWVNAVECSDSNQLKIHPLIKYYNPNGNNVNSIYIKQWVMNIVRTDGLASNGRYN